MGIYLGEPLNKNAALAHQLIPEIGNPCATNVIAVPEGGSFFGEIDNKFVSMGFSVCSGIALINSHTKRAGFIHLYPAQNIEELDTEQLKKMNGSMATIVEGSLRRYKGRLIKSILQKFKVEYHKLIEVNTMGPEGRSEPFHIVFRPAFNQIVVARTSHNDTITYNAF